MPKGVENFLLHNNIVRNITTQNEARLGWSNKLRKERFQAIHNSFSNGLIGHIRKANRAELFHSFRCFHFRNKDKQESELIHNNSLDRTLLFRQSKVTLTT